MIKMTEAIFFGLIAGIIFTIAVCASGYEDEIYEERMSAMILDMEKQNMEHEQW